MTDSTITTLDESLNMDSTLAISLIEFNEQQKANIAAALQAVSDELIPGNNRSYSADHSLYNTNVVETISKQEDAKPIGIPNLSNECNSNQPVLLTHNFNEFVSLTKEELQIEKNMSQLETVKTKGSVGVDVLLKRINGDKCNEKDDTDNSQDSDYEETATIDFSKFIDYICPKCDKNCGTYGSWKSHTDEEHQFNTSAWYKLRTTNKNGKLFYQCLVCMEELSTTLQFNQLQAHFIKHLTYNDYLKCNICCHRFKQIQNVKDHLRNFHRKFCRRHPKVQIELDMEFIDIFCPICQQLQLNRNSWWKHLKEKHNYVEEIRSKITEEDNNVYTCKVCKQKLRHNSIKNHMLWHEKYKSFQCTLCKKESATVGNAVSHKRCIHFCKEQDKSFKCSFCKQSFKNWYLRRKHISDKHSDDMPTCSVCKQWFYSNSFLLDHMKRHNHFE